MKKLSEYVLSRLGAGLLAVAPIYLAGLLLLKATKSLTTLVRPLSKLLPEWLPAQQILSFLLVLIACFLLGLVILNPIGRTTWRRIQKSLLQRIPGYALFRSLTQQLTGKAQDQAWKPALAEIEEALVPAFIIEEHEDGRLTVFVPSVPTPFAGAVYILSPDRVHPLDVPFSLAIKAVSHWGLGTRDLVAAMDRNKTRVNVGTRDDLRSAP